MHIRPPRNPDEIDQAIDIYWANEPPADPAQRPLIREHWLSMSESDPEGFWLAEDEATGRLTGLATAIRRPPQWLLLNFYVLPGWQGRGIGRALLAKAYENRAGCTRFSVHASQNPAAQSLYMQFGMYPQPYSVQFRSRPRAVTAAAPAPRPGLSVAERPPADCLPALNALDEAALGFRREVDHRRWEQTGRYYLVQAQGEVVAYFRTAPDGRFGPLVTAGPEWMAPVLEQALSRQQALSPAGHEVLAPGANTAALAHLLARGYEPAEVLLFLSSQPMPGLAQAVFHDMDFL